MNTIVIKATVATITLAAAAISAASVPGCSSTSTSKGPLGAGAEGRTGTTASAFTGTFSGDGGVTTANAVVQVRFVADPVNNPTALTYALWIGENYHPVTGCQSSDILSIMGMSLDTTTLGTQADATANHIPGDTFSCVTSANSSAPDYGNVPLGTNIYIDATERAYFPTGANPGEYYSFGMNDQCLQPVIENWFKLTDRINDGDDVDGTTPPDLQAEVKLACGGVPVGNGSYVLYASADDSCTLPGTYDPTLGPGNCCSTDACIYNAQFAVIESDDAQGRSTYLPVYRVNGLPIANDDGSGNGVYSNGLVALAARLGLTISPSDQLTVLQSFESSNTPDPKAGVRFWDLCVPEAAGPGGVAPTCPFSHFVFPAAAGGSPDAGSAGPVLYNETPELEGSFHQELVGNPASTTFNPFFPTFAGCEETLETTFGAQANSASTRRAWVDGEKTAIQKNSPGALSDPRFQCPASPANTCTLGLGDPQEPSATMSYAALRDALAAVASSPQCANATALTITLNSDVHVEMSPGTSLILNHFRDVNIVGAGGELKNLVFDDNCTIVPPATVSPCAAQTAAERWVLEMPPTDNTVFKTRNLRLDHVAMGYTAAPATGFGQSVIMIHVEGDTSVPDRVVLSDSTIATDTTSGQFVSQALYAESADVFVVRSTVGGTTNASSFWQALEIHDSLLVLTGTTNGVETTPASVLGAGGGLKYENGANDVLAFNAVVQGPVFTNAASRAMLFDATLQRAANKSAFYFADDGTAGAPPSAQVDWGLSPKAVPGGPVGQSNVTNLQTGSTVAFASYRTTVPPSVWLRGTVKFWNSTNEDGTFTNPVAPSSVSSSPFEKVVWCKGNGGLEVLNVALKNEALCTATTTDAGAH